MMDLNEHSPNVYRQFYETASFMIIPIDTIINLRNDFIVLRDRKYIAFPLFINYLTATNWLHDQL